MSFSDVEGNSADDEKTPTARLPYFPPSNNGSSTYSRRSGRSLAVSTDCESDSTVPCSATTTDFELSSVTESNPSTPSKPDLGYLAWILLTYMVDSESDGAIITTELGSIANLLHAKCLITTATSSHCVFKHGLLFWQDRSCKAPNSAVFEIDKQRPLVIVGAHPFDGQVERAYKFCLQDARVDMDQLKDLPCFETLNKGVPGQLALCILTRRPNNFNSRYIREQYSPHRAKAVEMANRLGGMRVYISTGKLSELFFSPRVSAYLGN